MAQFAGGTIEAFCGPKNLGATDDLEIVIIDFIRRARRSLFIAVQELDSEPIAQAIIDAKWRGVKVLIILEQDYLARKSVPKPLPKDNETQQQARHRVQWSEYRRPTPGFGKLHHKLMVIDNAIVVGGSFNYTSPANNYNDENVFVIGSPYEKLFKNKSQRVDVKECARIADFFRTAIKQIIARSDPY